MKCPICGKKKATIHLTEIVDGKVTETHICESCAKDKSSEIEQDFGLGDLLAGLSGFVPQTQATPVKEDIVCKKCGLQYEEFKEYGRLGCSQCYADFEKPLGRLLKKIHGSQHHLGKRPLKYNEPQKEQGDLSKDVKGELKEKLQQAIDSEEFERAAMLRDQLRTLENNE